MKKLLSIVMAFIIVASVCASIGFTTVSATESVWDGSFPDTGAGMYSGGSGTKDDPYLISNALDLVRLSRNSNNGIDTGELYFKLTTDIALNANYENYMTWVTDASGVNSWNPICKTGMFIGHIDGDGHVIRGMYVNISSAEDNQLAGFIGGLKGFVSNLGFENCVVIKNTDSGKYAGTVCGALGAKGTSVVSTISNCYVKDCYTAAFRGAGLMVGLGYSGNIENCYAIGTIGGGRSGECDIGGLVAWYNGSSSDKGAITNCYVLPTFNLATGASVVGGICGNISNTTVTITNVYFDKTACGFKAIGYGADGKVVGEPVDKAMAEMNITSMSFDETTWKDVENNTPVLKVFVPHVHVAAETVIENEHAPTAGVDGYYDEVVYCKDCGAEMSRNRVTIPAPAVTATTNLTLEKAEISSDGKTIITSFSNVKTLGKVAGAENSIALLNKCGNYCAIRILDNMTDQILQYDGDTPAQWTANITGYSEAKNGFIHSIEYGALGCNSFADIKKLVNEGKFKGCVVAFCIEEAGEGAVSGDGYINSIFDEGDIETYGLLQENCLKATRYNGGYDDAYVLMYEPSSTSNKPDKRKESIWNGTYPEGDDTADTFSGGTGTVSDPFIIASAADLARLGRNSNSGKNYQDTYFKLTTDIVLNTGYKNYSSWGNMAPANTWNPIGKSGFYGHIDGNGHIIKGLYVSQDSAEWSSFKAGFIGDLRGSVTKLGFEYCYVQNNTESGLFAGIICAGLGTKNSQSVASITQCYVNNSKVACFRGAGLIAGNGYSGEIRNCYAIGTISGGRNGETDSGALVGYMNNKTEGDKFEIEDCYALPTFDLVEGALTASGNAIGCLAGNIQELPGVSMKNSYYDSKFSGYSKIVGYYPGSISSNLETEGKDMLRADMTVKSMGFNSEIWVDSSDGPVLKVFATQSANTADSFSMVFVAMVATVAILGTALINKKRNY